VTANLVELRLPGVGVVNVDWKTDFADGVLLVATFVHIVLGDLVEPNDVPSLSHASKSSWHKIGTLESWNMCPEEVSDPAHVPGELYGRAR